ncbi:MAG: hypothetical protein SGI92_32405 [Bryobacteraceae bacterium]|nr:hypothetical protein [Bryobacteraceae bacterium]
MFLYIFAAALACPAQRVLLYSPLTRIDPFGEVVKADRGTAEPRDILSPGVPRNGNTPLRIVVEMDKPETYWLEIGQNPADSLGVKLWKEVFVETPAGWIPDTLEEVSHPYRGFVSDFKLPGQKIVSFWLELTVPKNADVDRMKVEPQMYVDSLKDWIIYPMEVRIHPPQLPDAKPSGVGGPLPALTAPADAALHSVLCGNTQKTVRSGQLTNRERLRDYASQDLTLLKNRAELEPLFLKVAGATDLTPWCTSPKTLSVGPEWYLRLRDAIYRAASTEPLR